MRTTVYILSILTVLLLVYVLFVASSIPSASVEAPPSQSRSTKAYREDEPSTISTERSDEPELYIISYRSRNVCSEYVKKRAKHCDRTQRFWCSSVRINAQSNISVNYLGDNLEEKYIVGHVRKILDVYDYLISFAQQFTVQQQQRSVIVMFVDAFDTVLQFNSTEIIRRFLRMKSRANMEHKVIWQAEHNCYPGHPRNLDRSIYCDTSSDAYPQPPEGNDGTWLNAGGWIGYLHDVIANFGQFIDYIHTDGAHDAVGDWRGDQEIISMHFINRSEYMTLDYYSEIMQAMIKMWNVMELTDQGYYNPHMQRYPVTLHWNGDKEYILGMEQKLALRLFAGSQGKVDGEYEILLTNYNQTRRAKYKDICSSYPEWYY